MVVSEDPQGIGFFIFIFYQIHLAFSWKILNISVSVSFVILSKWLSLHWTGTLGLYKKKKIESLFNPSHSHIVSTMMFCLKTTKNPQDISWYHRALMLKWNGVHGIGKQEHIKILYPSSVYERDQTATSEAEWFKHPDIYLHLSFPLPHFSYFTLPLL